MFAERHITEADWHQTPQPVRTLLLSLSHQLRRLRVRCAAYEHRARELEKQLARTRELEAKVAELTERFNQNSRNSSKPPSTDSPVMRPRRTHESSGRKAGGQPGHVRCGRKLKPLTEVDHFGELKPVNCAQCGHQLLGEDPQPPRHQVSEIPPAKVVITESRRHTLTCPGCGTATQAEWPQEMPRGSFGPRTEARAAFLTGRLGASHRDVIEAMETLPGLELGELFCFFRELGAGKLKWPEFQTAMEPVISAVTQLLQAGTKCGQPKTQRTCRKILTLGSARWTFVRVPGIAPDHKAAERPLRRAVIWRRKSFGTQSQTGRTFVERILTTVTSLRQQGRDVLAYLSAICARSSNNDRLVCLLPNPP